MSALRAELLFFSPLLELASFTFVTCEKTQIQAPTQPCWLE